MKLVISLLLLHSFMSLSQAIYKSHIRCGPAFNEICHWNIFDSAQSEDNRTYARPILRDDIPDIQYLHQTLFPIKKGKLYFETMSKRVCSSIVIVRKTPTKSQILAFVSGHILNTQW